MRISSVLGISLSLLAGCGSEGGFAAPSSGGTPAANGGNSSSGGSSITGQSSANQQIGGSSTSKGGSVQTGGASTGSGGTSVVLSGGTSSAPDTKASGGTAQGGTSASAAKTGGASAKTAGGTSTNASGGATGGAVAGKCDNLRSVAGATGQAKPSGAVGGLKVLDWAGFKSAISYTFDDSNSSQISNYKAMNDAGGHYTFYLQTGKSKESSDGIWKTALQDGHELGNHTSDHSNCTSASVIDSASSFIKTTFGVTNYSFAAPNGSTACQTYSNKFVTNRSVAGGGSMSPGDTASLTWLPADIATASNLAPASGKWRVICIHGFTGGSDGAYQPIALSSFTSAVSSAVAGGSWVENATNVAAYQVGQKAIPKTAGNSTTWTLPAVFPPNMCVRATVTGGTVKQNGVEVPWNEHGYYEISLDAKQVTVE